MKKIGTNMKYKAVLFDLDGTLVDTAPDIMDAVKILMSHYKKPIHHANELHRYISQGSITMLSQALNFTADDPRLPELRQKLFDAYEKILHKKSKPFPGIPQLLIALQQQAIPWGVVTNKPYWFAKEVMTKLNLIEHCRVLVGPDCAGANSRKPNPGSLLYACCHINQAPQHVVYVGDCAHDITAAHNANMQAIAVTWGYYPPDSQPTAWNADSVCHTAEELRAALTL